MGIFRNALPNMEALSRQLLARKIAKFDRPALMFTEVFGQPKSFRGRSVRIKGTLRGLEKLRAPANDYGIDDYFQGWLEPAGGPASPVIVHFRDVPEGMPLGLEISEPVVVSGCFLKNMAYRARDGVRVAPLLVALSTSALPCSPNR